MGSDQDVASWFLESYLLCTLHVSTWYRYRQGPPLISMIISRSEHRFFSYVHSFITLERAHELNPSSPVPTHHAPPLLALDSK